MTPGRIRQGGQYHVYANVTETGNPASGVASVTANLTSLDTGTGSVAMTTAGGPWTIGSTTYTYRTAVLTANTPLSTGTSYAYSVTAVDNASNSSGATSFSVLIETYAQVIQATGGIASYWRLNETSGTTAADSAGTNTGTYQATPTLGQATVLVGDSGFSVRFTRTSSEYVNIPHSTSLNLAGGHTLEAWVRSNSLINNSTIMAKTNNAGTNGYRLQRNGGANTATYVTNGTTPSALNSTVSLNDGNWHHIVVTWNGGNTKRIYFDGQLDTSQTTVTGSMSTNTNDFRIARPQTNGNYWDGWIDEVAVYSAALTAADVLDHYNAGIGNG